MRSIILAVTILSFCVFLVTVYPRLKSVSYTDMSPYISTTIDYADGSQALLKGTEFGPINKGDKINMEISLPIEEKTDPSIMTFGANHAVTQVFFNDKLLTSYGEDIAARGDLICHHNYFVEIPEDAWGQTITVSMEATENRAFNRIAMVWLYPAGKAYQFYFDLEFGRMVVSFSVLIISVTTLLAMPLLMQQWKKRYIQLLYMALFGIVSAMWMVLAEGLQQFFDVDSYLLTTLEFVGFIAQIIPLGCFVLAEEAIPERRKMLKCLIGIDGFFVALICVLNYCNISHFPETIWASVVFIIINGVVFAWNSLRSMDFSITSKRASLLGVAVLSLTGIFDVIRFSLYRSIGLSIFNHTEKTFPLGVLIFYFSLLLSAIISDREQQELERHNRAKLLASQIQPHFLYNTLASIRELIFENPEHAANTLQDFTTYLRGAVRAVSDVQVVSFAEELKNIKAYAEIEKVRMPKRLEVIYQIEAEDFVVPPFSIQPLVENAIRHGIYKRGSNGGCVTIHSFEEKEKWIIKVSDTGTGFDVPTVMEKARKIDCESAGLKNLISRLKEITHASISIESAPDSGTMVTVGIPKKHNIELRVTNRAETETSAMCQ